MSCRLGILKAEAVGELAAEIGLRAALLAEVLEAPIPPAPELVRCLRLLTDARARLNAARAALAALEHAAQRNDVSPARGTSMHATEGTIAAGTGQ